MAKWLRDLWEDFMWLLGRRNIEGFDDLYMERCPTCADLPIVFICGNCGRQD